MILPIVEKVVSLIKPYTGKRGNIYWSTFEEDDSFILSLGQEEAWFDTSEDRVVAISLLYTTFQPLMTMELTKDNRDGDMLRYFSVWQRDCDLVEGTEYQEVYHKSVREFKKSCYQYAEGPVVITEISKAEYESKVGQPDDTYRDRITEAFENGNQTGVMV